MLHASNRLKHTDYDTFDPRLFLILSKKLFELTRQRASKNQLSILEIVDQATSASTGHRPGMNTTRFSILKRLRDMELTERIDIQHLFEGLVHEIDIFLPIQEKPVEEKKNVEKDDFEETLKSLEVLVID